MQKGPVVNIRDEKTNAPCLPQYNLVNFGKDMFKQTFLRICHGNYPEYIDEYMQNNEVSWPQVTQQLQLVADLIDGLYTGKFRREEGKTYLQASMEQCQWFDRFDYKAMAVFDMIASQGVLASFFASICDTITKDDIQFQGPEDLKSFIKHRNSEMLDTVKSYDVNYTPCKKECEDTEDDGAIDDAIAKRLINTRRYRSGGGGCDCDAQGRDDECCGSSDHDKDVCPEPKEEA